MFEFWFMFPVAIVVATIATCFGICGGVFFTPLLAMLLLDIHYAIGTALLTQVFGMSSGTYRYIKQKQINYGIVFPFMLAAVPGAIFGSYLSFSTDASVLKGIFGIVVILFAAIIIRPIMKNGCDANGKEAKKTGILAMMPVPFAGGLLTGLISAGEGELTGTYLREKLRLHAKYASAIAVPVIMITAVVSSVVHIGNASVLWDVAVFTVPGVLIGGQIGPRINRMIDIHRFNLALSAVLLLIGSLMLYSSGLAIPL